MRIRRRVRRLRSLALSLGGGAFDLLLQDELFLAAEFLQFRRVLLRKTRRDGKDKAGAWPSFTWT